MVPLEASAVEASASIRVESVFMRKLRTSRALLVCGNDVLAALAESFVRVDVGMLLL